MHRRKHKHDSSKDADIHDPLHKSGKTIKLLIGSFNMGNAEIDKVWEWIPPEGKDYDIIALGMQESTFKPTACNSWKEGDADTKLQEPDRHSFSESSRDPSEDVTQRIRVSEDEDESNQHIRVSEGEDRSQQLDEVTLPETRPEKASTATSEKSILDKITLCFNAEESLRYSQGVSREDETKMPDVDANPMDGQVKREKSMSEKSYDPFDDVAEDEEPDLAEISSTGTPKNEEDEEYREQLAKNRHLSVTKGSKDKTGAVRLKEILKVHLGNDFKLVRQNRRGQMQLNIYARKSIDVSNVEIAGENTGIGHVINNKGGLVCKMSVYGTTLCFVSCHLQAHEGAKNCKARNASCAEILGGSKVGHKSFDLCTQFHHVFWFGDLNYRTDFGEDSKMTWKEKWDLAKQYVDSNQYEKIYEYDELKRELEAKRLLYDFKTPTPNFAPTFKVHRHKKLEYNEKRIPSYTDRILWKSLPGVKDLIAHETFEACFGCESSDHKPVRASFSIQLTPVSFEQHLLRKAAAHLTFSNLRGQDLEAMDLELAGGKSDPYIVFYSDPSNLLVSHVARHPRTSVKNKSLNPSWEGEEIQLTLQTVKEEVLTHSHILLKVMDKDFMNPDDLIGVAVFPLSMLFDSEDMECDFSLPVEKKGLIKGSIHGHANFQELSTRSHRRGSHGMGFKKLISSSKKVPDCFHQSNCQCKCSIS